MPQKQYKKLIDQALLRFKNDPDIADQHLIGEYTSADDGEMFYCISAAVLEAPADAPFRRFFDDSNLDPKNPFHWLELVQELAEIHYSRGAPGPEPTRTSDYFASVLHHYSEARTKNPLANEEEIRKALKSHHYPKLADTTIRRLIAEAKRLATRSANTLEKPS